MTKILAKKKLRFADNQAAKKFKAVMGRLRAK